MNLVVRPRVFKEHVIYTKMVYFYKLTTYTVKRYIILMKFVCMGVSIHKILINS